MNGSAEVRTIDGRSELVLVRDGTRKTERTAASAARPRASLERTSAVVRRQSETFG
jgi:hypothetical protein